MNRGNARFLLTGPRCRGESNCKTSRNFPPVDCISSMKLDISIPPGIVTNTHLRTECSISSVGNLTVGRCRGCHGGPIVYKLFEIGNLGHKQGCDAPVDRQREATNHRKIKRKHPVNSFLSACITCKCNMANHCAWADRPIHTNGTRYKAVILVD